MPTSLCKLNEHTLPNVFNGRCPCNFSGHCFKGPFTSMFTARRGSPHSGNKDIQLLVVHEGGIAVVVHLDLQMSGIDCGGRGLPL